MPTRQEAFEAVYRAHRHSIRGYLCSKVGIEDADDLTSRVFIIAWQKFDPDDPCGIGWLIETAKFIAIEYRRNEQRRRTAQDTLETFVAGASPGIDIDTRATLAQEIRKLAAREQEMIRLTYWAHVPAKDIARLFHMNENAVNAVLSRARKKLRLRLQDDPAEEVSDHDAR
ncbi:RNA polymerase sigma factor [Microbacterium sp.]|uniref:RNA polymerase sigma factor n=1 Tax=Microbacterium sp. TaxID=51671 RepID=UPI0039E4F6C6